MSNASHYCITFAANDLDRFNEWCAYFESVDCIDAAVAQWEEGEGGYLHGQGHLWCCPQQRLRRVIEILHQGRLAGESVHAQVSRDAYASIRYCLDGAKRHQEDALWFLKESKIRGYRGQANAGGKGTAFTTAAEELFTGKRTLQEVMIENPGMVAKNMRAFETCLSMRAKIKPTVNVMPEVYILWGLPGTGKSRSVWDNNEQSEIFVPLIGNRAMWFDNYHGEKVLLLDDFDPGCCSLKYLLKLTDRYPMQLQVKCGSVWKHWEKVYLTSNENPRDWYPQETADTQAALMRRVTRVSHYGQILNVDPQFEFIHPDVNIANNDEIDLTQ